MTPNRDEESSECMGEIRVYEGVPKNSTRSRERSRFERFLAWLSPRFAAKRDLAERLLMAKVEQEEAKARKLEANTNMNIENAAFLAAKRDTLEQESYKGYCDILDHDVGLGEGLAAILKLAKFMELNHPAQGQLQLVLNLIEYLKLKYGTDVEIIMESLEKYLGANISTQGDSDEDD